MHIDLSGRSAFVSGSTQGIGRAIAARLAACGAVVTINGRDEAGSARSSRSCGASSRTRRFEGVAADVAPPTARPRLFDGAPRVDILINNLGIFAPTPLLEVDDDTWQRFWDVNVMSAIRLTRHYIPG